MKKQLSIWLTIILVLGMLLPGFPKASTAKADSNVIVQNNFDDGTAQGWGPRGSVSVTSVSETSHSGTNSLKTSGRTASWNGPSLNVTNKLVKGATYEISGYVKLVAGQTPSNLKFTVQRDNTDGTTKYDEVTSATPVTDSGWVKLDGKYTFSTDVTGLQVYLESDSATSAYYLDDFTITIFSAFLPIQQDIPSLKDVYANDFLIGAAVLPDQLQGPQADLLKKHFNSLVPGNAMKPDSLEHTKGVFTWDDADKIAQFAKDSNMKLRFHTLVWHQQTPNWFFQDDSGNWLAATPENKQLVLSRLQDYIRTVLGRYKNDIESVDVVNEVIDPSQPDGMRHSKWYELTGTDYIKTAFETAREVVGPNVKLYINDYNTDDPTKRDILYNLVKGLLAEGVQIDGVGHQTHVSIDSPSIANIGASIDKFASLGLDNKITELDVSLYNNNTDNYGSNVPQDVLIKQGYRYKELFALFKEKHNEISQVITWGIADNETWLSTFPTTRTNLPLLFDTQLQAKYAYWGVVDPSKLPVPIKNLDVLNATPKVDGKSDLVWDGVSNTAINGNNQLSASFKTLYDNNFLYVFANVKDPTIGANGSIDLFVDGNNGKTNSYQADDKHYSFKITNEKSDGPDYKIKELEDGSGYNFETAIPLSDVQKGKKIGFDIRVSNGDKSFSWNDITNSQDTNTSKFGTLTLKDPVMVAQAVKGTPIIDGVEDKSWEKANILSTDRWVQGTSGSTAKVKTMWDQGYLYILANVTDKSLSDVSSNAYEQDSVEIFVDQNNGKTTNYQSDDGQYRVNFNNLQSYGGHASANNFTTATKRTADGYIVEAAIKLDSPPKPGTSIGFDVQVNNDDNGDGKRDSVAVWSDPTGQSYQNTSRLGVLQLSNGAMKE